MNIHVTCDEIEELLSAALDGELDSRRQAQVQAHLESCPACRREFAEMQQLSAMLPAWQPPQADPQLSVIFVERLAAERTKPRGWARLLGTVRARLAWGAGLAAVTMALSCGLYLQQQKGRPIANHLPDVVAPIPLPEPADDHKPVDNKPEPEKRRGGGIVLVKFDSGRTRPQPATRVASKSGDPSGATVSNPASKGPDEPDAFICAKPDGDIGDLDAANMTVNLIAEVPTVTPAAVCYEAVYDDSAVTRDTKDGLIGKLGFVDLENYTDSTDKDAAGAFTPAVLLDDNPDALAVTLLAETY